MHYLPSRKAAQIIGVHPNTLRTWDSKGYIKTIRTNSGQRLYDVTKYLKNRGIEQKIILYARVSSKKQENDLQRQIDFLKEKYLQESIIKDISSSLNYKRRGLCSILEQAMSGTPIKLVVTHKDRLARFGFDLIELIVKKSGGEILVLNQDQLSPEEELTEDMLSTIHSFSSRLYGLRKYDKIKVK
jgi:predicted site-specific integrase-resolvase